MNNFIYTFVEKNSNQLHNIARYIISGYLSRHEFRWFNEDDYEEVEMDSTLKLLSASNSYDPTKGSVLTYYRAIVLSCLKDYLKKNAPLALKSPMDNYDLGDNSPEMKDLNLAYSSEEIFIAKEGQILARRYLASVNETVRECMRLYFYGYRPREIQKKLGIPSGRISVIIHRAKKALADYFTAAA